MTEDEAKTKWCPYTTLGDTTESCIGSGCMAWRWGADIITDIEEVTLPRGEKPDGAVLTPFTNQEYGKEYWSEGPTVSSGFSKWRKYVRHKGGHCGLAGKP